MTKIEIINEMYNVINNNADVFEYPHKHMTEYYADKVRTTKKATLEQWLAKLNAMVEEANEVKTVETEVENDTEKNVEDMTKSEILAEIKNVIIENYLLIDNFFYVTDIHFMTKDNGDVIMRDDNIARNMFQWKNMKYLTKKQLVEYLNYIKWYCDERKNGVTDYLTKDTEYVAEPKATKKDIIMGLHNNNEVKCDLATAEALATEGFIYIRNYEDGVLYGEVEYDAVCEDLIDEDDLDLFDEVREGGFYRSDIEQVTDWYDAGLLKKIWYSGNGLWRCDMDWNNILDDFCKRWDNKLNKAA